MLSDHVLHNHTGADIGIEHDGMRQTGVVGRADMLQDEGAKILSSFVESRPFGLGSGVGMASFSNVGSSGIGGCDRSGTRINRGHPGDSAWDASKLGSWHESTNKTSGATTTVGRVSGSSSIELFFKEASGSRSRFFLANGVHGVCRWNGRHGEIDFARD